MVACRNETWRSHYNAYGLAKPGFHNKAAAKRKARRILGVKLETYRCAECGLFHYGSRPKESS